MDAALQAPEETRGGARGFPEEGADGPLSAHSHAPLHLRGTHPALAHGRRARPWGSGDKVDGWAQTRTWVTGLFQMGVGRPSGEVTLPGDPGAPDPLQQEDNPVSFQGL